MSRKVLYFDVETTGLDCRANDIIQLAGLVEIDGEVKEEFDINMQPLNWESIQQEALAVHGITVDKLKTYMQTKNAYGKFVGILSKYCDKFDKADKFYVAGYNVNFDLDFLGQFFVKQNDPYLGSWINWRKLDPLPILHILDFKGKLLLPDYKLETVANHMGIEIKAHDALSDVRATRQILQTLLTRKS